MSLLFVSVPYILNPKDIRVNSYVFSTVFLIIISSVLSNGTNIRPSQSNGQTLAQRQYFKTRPQPSVEVVEGGTVVLTCSIGNQRGSVQWAKDGFVLGYDRTIPGYARYSMIGDANSGVHNLHIANAKSEDNGEFQCQVGPGGNNTLPIRATTKLTVLIPPNSIDITGYSNSSVVEIRRGASLTLECVVSGGKPAANIKWYRKNVELRTDHLQIKESTSVSSLADSDSATNQLPQSINIKKSSITIAPNADDNGVPYTCEAVHRALLVPLRHTLTLSVLYPPGPPEITGYTEGETVRMGDTLTLVCRSNGGNPLAQLVWYKNDEQVDFSYTTTSNRQSSNSHTFLVDASDNNAIYRCVASSPITDTPMVANVKLAVHFAPSKVIIDGPKEAKAGDTITMSCTTERSNPPSEISWVVDGRPISASNSIAADPTGGWITSANVTVTITNQDRNMKMLSCYAINQALGETIVETSVLNILYPPDPPSIFGYEQGTSIRAGTLQRLTCVCHGGNPLCQLKWFKGDQEVTHGTSSSSNGNVISNEISIVTKDSDNGAQYRCLASNTATSEPLTASITLTVHFPPSGVYIKVNPKQPKSTSQLELICETGSSNPQSMVTWWRDGFLIPGHQDSVTDGLYGGKTTKNILMLNVTSDDDGAVITCQATNRVLQQSVHDATTLNILYAPEFLSPPLTQYDLIEGQTKVINHTARGNPLTITYKWSRGTDQNGRERPLDPSRFIANGALLNVTSIMRSDAGIYTLHAINEMGMSETAIKINVHYSASILKISELIMVDEESNAVFECLVDANPTPDSTIVWKKRKSITGNVTESITTGGNYLEIDAARMRQTLEKIDSDRVSTDGNDSMADASTGKRITLKSTLVIYNATLEDSGTGFDCVANNGIGQRDIATGTLLVLHKPIIDRSPLISKSASDNGSTGRVICRAQGAPNVTFTWSREGSILASSDSSVDKIKSLKVKDKTKDTIQSKYIIEQTVQLDLVTFQSVLSINYVSSSDYGQYECVARNDLGFDAITILFNRTSKPDPPIALRIINITESTITLRWIPGFDGGIGQSFRIRYKALDQDPTFTYRDVFPENVTQWTVTNLQPEEEYIFGVMSQNQLGMSDYTVDIVKAKTLKESPVTETEKIISKVVSEHSSDIPRLIIIVSIVGSSLLLFNIVLVVCFVRKRRRKRYEEESDYSAGGDSKTTGSSKTTIEMYQGSNSASYHKGQTGETSLSENDDEENKSQGAYSGHTDYEMEISPTGVVTTHHHGISTYLIDDAIAPSQHYPPHRYTNLGPIGPDVTNTNTYFIDHGHSDDYVSALRKNAYNHHLGSVSGSYGPASPSPVPSVTMASLSPMQLQVSLNHVDHHQDHMTEGQTMQQHHSPQSSSASLTSTTVPPLPPLRSLTMANMTSFLPSISEEPMSMGSHGPVGHLV